MATDQTTSTAIRCGVAVPLRAELMARQTAAWRRVIRQQGQLSRAREDGSRADVRRARRALADLYAQANRVSDSTRIPAGRLRLTRLWPPREPWKAGRFDRL